jgi:aminoglycoside phosphotransferase (APT) family kinase protein
MSDAFALARARRALSEAGLDMGLDLSRASSVTNEVWFAGEYVVRVNRQPNQRLRREAALGPLLPTEVGYPEVVAYGGQMGADWLVLKRRPGIALSRAWPTMELDQRRHAVSQLASKLRSLHRFEAPADLSPIVPPQLLGHGGLRTCDPLLSALERLATVPHVDRHDVDDLREIVLRDAPCLEPFAHPTLVHGDLTFENILWDGHDVSALLDFEWSRPGPPDMDLDILLRVAAYPYLHVAEDYEHLTRADDYAPIPYWLAEDYPELFAVPHLFERTRLYDIGFNVREVLAFPPPRPPRELSRHHPYNRLVRILQGASHLDELAGHGGFGAGDPAVLRRQGVTGPPPLSGSVQPAADQASVSPDAFATASSPPSGSPNAPAPSAWSLPSGEAPLPSRLPPRASST